MYADLAPHVKTLLLEVGASPAAQAALAALARERHRPHLEIRLADWAHRPATAVAVRVLAWRRFPIPLTPRYHVVTRYDDWCGRDGAWLTEIELRRHSMKKVLCFSPRVSTIHYGTLKKSLSLPRGTL